MSRVTGKPPASGIKWRRPITRTYDYNLSLGENYYKPQLDYISARKGRGNTPPSATTFAERLLKYPPGQRSASATRRAEEELGLGLSSSSRTATSTSATTREASLGRYSSLDDLGLDEEFTQRRRRLLNLQTASQENLATDRGVSPLMSPLSPAVERKSRVTFGEKMLDAIGVKDVASKTSQQKSLFSSEDGDVLDKILAERRNRRQQQQALTVQTADADLFTEDPLKSPRISSRISQARQEMDQMREEMRKDVDASTSRFRQKLRAKREREAREDQEQQFGSLSQLNDFSNSSLASNLKSSQQSRESRGISSSMGSSSTTTTSAMKLSSLSSSAQNLLAVNAEADECDAATEAILSKVDQIRKRAKARLAMISDDYPELQIESSLATRRAAGRQRQALMDDEFDSDLMSSRLANTNSSGASGRTVTVTRRALKTSFDVE